MAGTCKISFYRPNDTADQYNEVDQFAEPVFVKSLWADRTDEGSRRNIFASRITHENEVTFSFRWNSWVSPSMLVEVDDKRYQIQAVIPEGFRKYLHVKIKLNDNPSNE